MRKTTLSKDGQEYLLRLYEEYTGNNGEDIPFYDEADDAWWLKLSYSLNQTLAIRVHMLERQLEKNKQGINLMNHTTQMQLLDEWEELTGYDATQDSFFSWNDEEWWQKLYAAIQDVKAKRS